MSAFDQNPYSSLDEDNEFDIYTEDDDSLYSYDADAEWEETKEQVQQLFSLVLFPFVGKWLGKKFSFWGNYTWMKQFVTKFFFFFTLMTFMDIVWSKYMGSKTPFTTRYSILSTQMVNSIKQIA